MADANVTRSCELTFDELLEGTDKVTLHLGLLRTHLQLIQYLCEEGPDASLGAEMKASQLAHAAEFFVDFASKAVYEMFDLARSRKNEQEAAQ